MQKKIPVGLIIGLLTLVAIILLYCGITFNSSYVLLAYGLLIVFGGLSAIIIGLRYIRSHKFPLAVAIPTLVLGILEVVYLAVLIYAFFALPWHFSF